MVINVDLPWNPARLEQRVARAWRKHQPRSVQVINLVTANSIEQRMLQVLAGKRALADGLLDGAGELDTLPMPSGRTALVERLEELMGASGSAAPEQRPSEPPEMLRQDLIAGFGERLLLAEIRSGSDAEATLLLVVDGSSNHGEVRRRAETIVRRQQLTANVRPPRIEVLDRTTFETIARLAEAGVVQLTPAHRPLFRSSALPDPGAGEAERLVQRARESFARGERRQRMAAVLADGGFAGEALAPLGEAVQEALLCLARLAGSARTDHEPIPSDAVKALAQAGPPFAALAARAGRLADQLQAAAATPAEVSEQDVQAWIREGAACSAQIEQLLDVAAVGPLATR